MSLVRLLLHPSLEDTVDETVFIQGHGIRFGTMDLTASPTKIRRMPIRDGLYTRPSRPSSLFTECKEVVS